MATLMSPLKLMPCSDEFPGHGQSQAWRNDSQQMDILVMTRPPAIGIGCITAVYCAGRLSNAHKQAVLTVTACSNAEPAYEATGPAMGHKAGSLSCCQGAEGSSKPQYT